MVQPVCVFTVLTACKHGLQEKIPLSNGCCVPAAHSSGRSGTETFSMFFYCVCEGDRNVTKDDEIRGGIDMLSAIGLIIAIALLIVMIVKGVDMITASVVTAAIILVNADLIFGKVY